MDDVEYQAIQDIQNTFLGDPTNPLKYHQTSAKDSAWTEGCSMIYCARPGEWLTLTKTQRQSIFEKRHIYIQGLTLNEKIKFNLDAFDFLGVPPDRILEVNGLPSNYLIHHFLIYLQICPCVPQIMQRAVNNI
jgi:hypothetical protein